MIKHKKFYNYENFLEGKFEIEKTEILNMRLKCPLYGSIVYIDCYVKIYLKEINQEVIDYIIENNFLFHKEKKLSIKYSYYLNRSLEKLILLSFKDFKDFNELNFNLLKVYETEKKIVTFMEEKYKFLGFKIYIRNFRLEKYLGFQKLKTQKFIFEFFLVFLSKKIKMLIKFYK